MPVKSYLISLKDGKTIWAPASPVGPCLGTVTFARQFGRFKLGTRSTTGTTTIVTPPKNESIVVTDLIITAEKKNAGLNTLLFNDGTNTENVIVASVSDSPVNLAIPFAGLWQGWKDAYLQIVQTGANHYISVTVGYYYMSSDLSEEYARWNKLRDVSPYKG